MSGVVLRLARQNRI